MHCVFCVFLQLGVNLDTVGNGYGGIDHSVLFSLSVSPTIELVDPAKSDESLFKIGGGLTATVDIYWQVRHLCQPIQYI
jgi:hypothetical protein